MLIFGLFQMLWMWLFSRACFTTGQEKAVSFFGFVLKQSRKMKKKPRNDVQSTFVWNEHKATALVKQAPREHASLPVNIIHEEVATKTLTERFLIQKCIFDYSAFLILATKIHF